MKVQCMYVWMRWCCQMNVRNLIGLTGGIVIVFFLISYFAEKIDWFLLISMLVGGFIGLSLVGFIQKRDQKK